MFTIHRAVPEITVGHWPFSNQFQHLANQNPFWSANFTIYFQKNGRPIFDPYFYHCRVNKLITMFCSRMFALTVAEQGISKWPAQ